MPEGWVQFHETVSATLTAAIAAAATPSAWQNMLEAMTGQAARRSAAHAQGLGWQRLLDKLAAGDRWTAKSALLRPHFADSDGVPFTFVETARPAGYRMRLATRIPFGLADEYLPDIEELARAAL
jgi:hypothetical protein